MQVVGGRYRVRGRLGAGGAGEVLRVVDSTTGDELALKRLHFEEPDPRRRRQDELRFRREFHVLASLRHPCIVRVFDYGVDESGPWYTMELLDGPDLRDSVPLPIADACRILRDVASALAHLHARHLLHRDVAPRNVGCTADGHARLLDFGVLATMGAARDVAGTPPCIAPEALRRQPLDARADLFGLGSLGYFLLTGRFPYPARSVDELEGLWRRRTPPPSKRRGDVPQALDELVMSLVSLDPLGRPGSAVEVVDRLGGIASLGAPPGLAVDRGSFGSAALVGRSRHLRRLDRSLRAALSGQGGAVIVEGPSGIGKSRLLREIELRAKTAGAVVVTASGDSGLRGPHGVLQELTRGLLEAAPKETLEAAEPHARQLVRALPAIAVRLAHVEPATLSGDPAEDRLSLHQALVAWLLAVAGARALVLLVDDAQRADEASAAVLASLAHGARRHPVLVCAAVRTDEPARAPTALSVVADAADRVHLRGLEIRHVARMLRSLFGDVPNVERLAEGVHGAVGGNPLEVLEIVRHLAERGLVRYVDGIWVLPAEVRRRDLPDGLTEALDARVRELAKPSLALAQALCVHEGDFSLDLCVALGGGDEREAFGALDGLLGHEVLVGSGYRYSFRHDGLREAIRRTVDPRRLPRVHLALGKALLATGDGGDAEVGWHLLRGGDAERGAGLLARAGRRLFESQSFSDAIAPLEDALALWEQAERSPRECLELRHMLLVSGVMADRAVVLRYADRTIEALRRFSGAATAARLGPVLGRHLALFLGVAWAFARWLFTRPSRRGPNPLSALSRFFVSVTYAATAFSLSFDSRRTQLLVDALEPFAVLRNRMLYAAYLMTRSFHDMPIGRFGAVRERAARALEIAERDRLTPISPVDRSHGIGAALYMLASTRLLDHDAGFQPFADRLERLELRFFSAAALVLRALHHRLRGEEETARALDEEANATLIQLGSAWILESQREWASSFGYALCRDLLGLRRSMESLVRLTDEGYRIEALAELARGEYFRERGELEASLRAIDAALDLGPPGPGFVRQAALSARAETLLAIGRPAEAMRVAEEAVELGDHPEHGRIAWKLRAARVHALGQAALGDQPAAAAQLDALLEEAAPLESPTLSGMLHEARARVALLVGDREGYATHRDAVRRWFRGTRNPALVSRADRLVEAGGGEISAQHAIDVLGDDVATVRGARRRSLWVSEVLDRCAGPEERAARALEVILHETGAREGHLYLWSGRELEHAAPGGFRRPPAEVEAALARALARAGDDDEPQTVVETGREAFHTLLLASTEQGAPVCAGAAALLGDGTPLRRPDPAMLDAIVRKLVAHGDVPAETTTDRSG